MLSGRTPWSRRSRPAIGGHRSIAFYRKHGRPAWRWIRSHPNIVALALCLALMIVYVILHFPSTPRQRASLDVYVFDSTTTTTSYAPVTVEIQRVSASVSNLGSEEEVEASVSVYFDCNGAQKATVGAHTSPEDAMVESFDEVESGRATADIACTSGSGQNATFWIRYNSDDVAWDEAPGIKSFEFDLHAGAMGIPIELHVSLGRGRFSELDESSRLSPDRAFWSDVGNIYARGQISDPSSASRIQTLDSVLLLVAGALAGVVMANLLSGAAVSRRARLASTTRRPVRRRLSRKPPPGIPSRRLRARRGR
jgi:hypothetical protein